MKSFEGKLRLDIDADGSEKMFACFVTPQGTEFRTIPLTVACLEEQAEQETLSEATEPPAAEATEVSQTAGGVEAAGSPAADQAPKKKKA